MPISRFTCAFLTCIRVRQFLTCLFFNLLSAAGYVIAISTHMTEIVEELQSLKVHEGESCDFCCLPLSHGSCALRCEY